MSYALAKSVNCQTHTSANSFMPDGDVKASTEILQHIGCRHVIGVKPYNGGGSLSQSCFLLHICMASNHLCVWASNDSCG